MVISFNQAIKHGVKRRENPQMGALFAVFWVMRRKLGGAESSGRPICKVLPRIQF